MASGKEKVGKHGFTFALQAFQYIPKGLHGMKLNRQNRQKVNLSHFLRKQSLGSLLMDIIRFFYDHNKLTSIKKHSNLTLLF